MLPIIIATLFLAPAPSALSAPVIGIGSMYDLLTPGVQSVTKRVYNTGDSTAFVRIELLEIHPAHDKDAEEIAQKEVTEHRPEKNRLIVTPLRMIIPPGGFQTVRILWPGERTAERYFRIRFTPVIPDSDDSFGLNKEAIGKYRQQSLQAGLNVLTGYGTIAIIQPDKPYFNSVVEATSPALITVENKGNATISLDNIRHCRYVHTDCGNISREFILPGRSKSVNKKAGYQTTFTLLEGNNQRVLNY
ncbi:hypothetical protein [Erwinia sp. V71]|uniref:hypothetical protein n=1 Tax=Erwinia sp. V71 TaxID=3369424 RepID=UPI003F5E3F02